MSSIRKEKEIAIKEFIQESIYIKFTRGKVKGRVLVSIGEEFILFGTTNFF